MIVRTGFVSNSSSCSFIVPRVFEEDLVSYFFTDKAVERFGRYDLSILVSDCLENNIEDFDEYFQDHTLTKSEISYLKDHTLVEYYNKLLDDDFVLILNEKISWIAAEIIRNPEAYIKPKFKIVDNR